MRELILPHEAPVRFAKYVISKDGDKAIVRNEFVSTPSLGMLIEAAAQSSAALAKEDEKGQVGYLTSLKNIKLLNRPNSLECDIAIELTHRANNIGYLSFEAKQSDMLIASGVFIVVIV